MILRARVILTMDGPPLEDGAVAIEGNRIAAVGHAADLAWTDAGPVVNLGDVVLMPGLINAHCHLDYTMMRHAIQRPKNFTTWVQRINALKRSLDDDDYVAAIARGFSELRKWGTTAVCNIEAFPELMPRLAPSPIRTWWFYEMIDIRHRITNEDVVAGALAFFSQHSRALDRFGLSPHAPYTASVSLYQLANQCAEKFDMLLTTHVAESRDEAEMFLHARGTLHDFMASLQRPMNDCGHGTSFEHLWRSGAIDACWLLVHMNELTEADFALLAAAPRGGGPDIVHCPRSHAYFSHSPFPFSRLHELGLNVCIGTDSLASTDSLSLLDEVRAFRATAPQLTPEELLRMVTVNPSAALRRRGELGQIAPGALADLIALPWSGSVSNVHEDVVEYTQPVPWMMIDGQICP